MQDTNWDRETSKTLACMFEKREEIRNFPQFLTLLKRNA
ncbi:hypothetical protein LEP1GSC038_0712 [Leptospira weilii str. 2006001855]|uniref:Uncharacterized protein n=1 Tax=Leptospira weilii str. 2006001855 TaxID=996804 RepID=M6G533_9LEPT|nr:hypothetical protein LEP1GSC038_0686 [Leptospira weilii str. 2006001855]EMM74046.1 hypothetical protein LEP1GSC038_0712 [Leptospira weilii str. 2006001855]